MFLAERPAIRRFTSRSRIEETNIVRYDLRGKVLAVLPIGPTPIDEPAFDVNARTRSEIRADRFRKFSPRLHPIP